MEALICIGLVASCALFSLVLSRILLSYGKFIDQHPAGGQETRDISLWSPAAFTRISVLVFWPLFIIGSFMVFQQSRFVLVGGIALITGLLLYLGTAVVFSAAVFRAMANGSRESSHASPVEGVLRSVSPFSSRQDTHSQSRSRKKSSRVGYRGYRK